jgi:hypothetical protein
MSTYFQALTPKPMSISSSRLHQEFLDGAINCEKGVGGVRLNYKGIIAAVIMTRPGAPEQIYHIDFKTDPLKRNFKNYHLRPDIAVFVNVS